MQQPVEARAAICCSMARPMQTIVSQLDAAFRKAIQAAFGIDADPLIGVAQNEKFGDYQANAAMGLAKQLAEKLDKLL